MFEDSIFKVKLYAYKSTPKALSKNQLTEYRAINFQISEDLSLFCAWSAF